MATLRTVTFTEHVSSGPGLAVDAEKSTLRRVKVLGPRSENGRDYPSATQQRAKGLFEESRVNIDHPAKPGEARSVTSRFGVLRNFSHEADGTYADLRYNPKHPLAESIVWWAQNEPAAIGLSINATGKVRRKNGRDIVEEITKVHSVDLVGDPATTNGLFESRGHRSMITVKQVLEAVYAKDAARLKVLREEMPPEPMAMDMEAPAESASPDEQIDAAFESMVCGVFRDKGLGTQEKIQKIKDILKAQEKLMGGGKEPPAEEKPAEESRKTATPPGLAELQEQLASLTREKKVRGLAAAAGVALTEQQVEALAAIPDEKKLALLIDGYKGQRVETPIKSGSAPLQEQRGGNGTGAAPKFGDGKSRLAFLRSGRV